MTQHYWECSTLSQTRKHSSVQCRSGQFLFNSIKAKEHGFSIYFTNSSLCRVPGPKLLEQYNNVASLAANMRAAFKCKDCCHWLECFQQCHCEILTASDSCTPGIAKISQNVAWTRFSCHLRCRIHASVSILLYSIFHQQLDEQNPAPNPIPISAPPPPQVWVLIFIMHGNCIYHSVNIHLGNVDKFMLPHLSLGFGKQFIGNNDRFHAFGMNLHKKVPRYWQYHLDKCCKMIFNISSNNQLTDSLLTGLLIPLAANQPSNQAHTDWHWSVLTVCCGQSLVNKEGMPEQISETSLNQKWSMTSSYQHHEGEISLYKVILLWHPFILI